MRTWDDIIREQRAIQGNYIAQINEVARMEVTEEDEILWRAQETNLDYELLWKALRSVHGMRTLGACGDSLGSHMKGLERFSVGD